MTGRSALVFATFVFATFVFGCAERAPSLPLPPGPVELADDAGTQPPEAPEAPPPEPEAPLRLRADVPPLSGGTMVVTSSGLAVAGDELTDQLWVLDVASRTLLGAVELDPGAMPGRAVEDAEGLVQVITRRGGELLRVDPRALEIVSRRRVCAAPRGLAFEAERGLVHVACAGGELLSLRPEGGEPVRALDLEPDLRDVVAVGDRLYVSRFRSAELLALDEDGAIVARGRPEVRSFPVLDPPIETEPHVAWRLVASGDDVLMIHQQMIASDLAAITVTSGGATYYIPEATGIRGGVPPSIVSAVATTFDASARPIESAPLSGVVVVDAIVTELGLMVASSQRAEVAVHRAADGAVLTFVQDPAVLFRRFVPHARITDVVWRPRALAMDPGREAFHRGTRAGVACASCHPEGHEDGHVWRAADTGPRRSQSLLGGLAGTEPFHWSGDLPSFRHLMSAQAARLLTEFSAEDQAAMLAWLDAQPAIPGRGGAASEDRAAFERAGCASCHAGEALSDELNHDVGAGPFQTPRLRGVLLRAPYFFDGCAPGLEATLDGTCRSIEEHGVEDPAERERVVSYLRSL